MAGANFFALSLKNPFDQNHLLRLTGTVGAFLLIAIDIFVSVFYFSTDDPVAVNSRFGLFLVVMVEGWTCTWFQLQTNLCAYAGSSTAFAQFEWRDLFESAYGKVNKSTICDDTQKMMVIATVCWVVPLLSALVAVGLMSSTRAKGSPEIRPQQYSQHCSNAMNTPLNIREGVFIAVVAGLAIIPAILGYHVDKSVLKSKLEFDSLVWATAADTAAQRRCEMLQDIEALEAAKFGGLVAPSDLARQGAAEYQFLRRRLPRVTTNHLSSSSSDSNSSKSSSSSKRSSSSSSSSSRVKWLICCLNSLFVFCFSAAPQAQTGVDKFLLQRAGPWSVQTAAAAASTAAAAAAKEPRTTVQAPPPPRWGPLFSGAPRVGPPGSPVSLLLSAQQEEGRSWVDFEKNRQAAAGSTAGG
ncbi:hypothetical protein Efla_002690 [Eimeria flavescens]